MSPSQLLDLWREAGTVLVVVAAPVVAVALVVGLVTSIVQAATQLNDSSLSFVPKLAALLLVLALGGNWLLGQLTNHMDRTFTRLTEIGRRDGR